MAKDHRRLAEEVAQGILLDDPGFLKEIVERVLQELLEAEMTEPQTPHSQDAGRHAEPAGSSGPRRDLLDAVVLALPAQREGFGIGAHGDVR